MSYKEPTFLTPLQAIERFGPLQRCIHGVWSYLEFGDDEFTWEPRYNDDLTLRGYERVNVK